MHEVGLSSDVLNAVLQRAAGRKVLGAGVRVGATHRVSIDALHQGFAHMSSGTVAQDATLDVDVIPANLDCRSCGAQTAVDDPMVACPKCHSIEVQVDRQDELTLVWVRYEG